MLEKVQNTESFNDILIIALTFNISSLLHSCRIKPCRAKLITAQSVQPVTMKSKICCFFILLENKVGFIHMHIHIDTNFCPSSQ